MFLTRMLSAAAIIIAVLFTVQISQAKGPKGGKGFKGGNWSSPPGWSQGQRRGWRGGSVPPGWSKGKKKGWRGRSMPPGHFKRQ